MVINTQKSDFLEEENNQTIITDEWNTKIERINFSNIWSENKQEQAVRLIQEFENQYWIGYHVLFVKENLENLEDNNHRDSDFDTIFRFIEANNLLMNDILKKIKVSKILNEQRINVNETLESVVIRLKKNFLKNHKFPFLLNHFINNQEKNFLYDHYVLQILIKSDDMLHLNESILSQDKLSEKTKDIIKDGTDKVLGLLGLDKKTD
mgnify:FL=1